MLSNNADKLSHGEPPSHTGPANKAIVVIKSDFQRNEIGLTNLHIAVDIPTNFIERRPTDWMNWLCVRNDRDKSYIYRVIYL